MKHDNEAWRNNGSNGQKGNDRTDDSLPVPGIFRKVTKWQDLWFYQKAEVLYQLTVVFCERFLPKFGDRTVDQMVQAGRSGKQNIVEGSEDGKTSTAMEINLLNGHGRVSGSCGRTTTTTSRHTACRYGLPATVATSRCRISPRATTGWKCIRAILTR